MIDFYHSPGSSCCVKVRFLLNEKDLDYREHLIDLRRGDQLTPEFRALNPKAEVPVLVHDGFVLPESTVIMEYVEDKFPEPALRPISPEGRARMRLWMKWPDEGGHIAYSSLAFVVSHRHQAHDATPGWVEAQLAEKPDATRQERQKHAIDLGFEDPALATTMRKMDNMIRDMQASLAARQWLAGDNFSLADIALIPYIVRLDVMTLLEIWRADCPRVFEWLAAVRQRRGYAPTYDVLDRSRTHQLMRENGMHAFARLKSLVEAAA
jgi:glutathione S-transferase